MIDLSGILKKAIQDPNKGYEHLSKLKDEDVSFISNKLGNIKNNNLPYKDFIGLIGTALGFLEDMYALHENTEDLNKDLNSCIDLACIATQLEGGK